MGLCVVCDKSLMFENAANGQSIEFHNLFEQKPTKGRSKQRPDGLHEHKYVRQLSEPYFSVSPTMSNLCVHAHQVMNVKIVMV